VARRPRLDEAARRLRQALPDGWTVSVTRRASDRSEFRITAPSGAAVDVEVKALRDGAPRSVVKLPDPDGPTIAFADWLSPRARDLLRSRGMSFLDTTGNTEIKVTEPGLFIRTSGADRNPTPKTTSGPRLRGPKAWALLRTLAEVPPPFGVRELAEAVDVDAGYVSRVVRVLADEVLVTRAPRGPITEVYWEGVIRTAATTYSFFDANETSTWVTTSGPDRLIDDLSGRRAGRWAVTGSFAAARLAPIAAPELAAIYTDDPDRIAKAGRLLPATRGANVVLAIPYDQIVLDRTVDAGVVTYVSTAQVALDCLTGNARMPAEGEALIAWMKKNESRWRTGTLAPRAKRRSA
jgi:hypothetical protein